MPKNVNILFDLGNVLIDIYPDLVFSKFAETFKLNLHADALQSAMHPLMFQFETGKIDEADFIRGISDLFKIEINNATFKTIWLSMLGDISASKIEYLQTLAKAHRIFLLSNTNPTHLDAIQQYIKTKYALPNLDVLFEKAFYSHQIGLHKPDLAVYDYVCKAVGINPAQTLFIDDNWANVESAKTLGFQTIHLTNRNQMVLSIQQHLQSNQSN